MSLREVSGEPIEKVKPLLVMTHQLTQRLHVALFIYPSLAETGKWGILYNSATQEKCIVLIVVRTEWDRWVDLSVCNHPFSSLISTSNEGSLCSIQCILCPDNCPCLAHQLVEPEERPFLASSLVLSTWVHNQSCFIIHQKWSWKQLLGPNWCQCLWQILLGTTSQALSTPLGECVQKLSLNYCQELSKDVVRC